MQKKKALVKSDCVKKKYAVRVQEKQGNEKTKRIKKYGIRIVSICMLAMFFILGRLLAFYVNEKKTEIVDKQMEKELESVLDENETTKQITPFIKANGEQLKILVDAGHGGKDPGKVGLNDTLEKDINLSIAMKLADKLKEEGVQVVCTREKDCSLGEGYKGKEKIMDLNNRIKLMEEFQPDYTVSIHQNSYPDENVKGPQVFYYHDSQIGKELAETIQATIIEKINPEKEREAKGNVSYYLLKKSVVPTVIVECGFLSNFAEANILKTEEYQNQMAEAIREGIMTYVRENNQ